jgi:hypothetical protein
LTYAVHGGIMLFMGVRRICACSRREWWDGLDEL